MKTKCYPFPNRNPHYPNLHDIIYNPIANHSLNSANLIERLTNYKRKISREAKTYKAQFFSIEREFLEATLFVFPSVQNSVVFSVKFGSIIKEACNLFELIARDLYAKFYTNFDEINIFNYLSLDSHLKFSAYSVCPIILVDDFSIRFPEVVRPFDKMKTWDKASDIQSKNPSLIPDWWTAYNKLKHSNAGLDSYATFSNSIASIGATFVLINLTYGPGVVSGFLEQPDINDPSTETILTVPSSQIFSHFDF